MSKQRFKLVPAVCIALRKDNKILLMKRHNTGWEDGKYALAGGGVDGEEAVLQAAVREAKEELGITLNQNDLKVVHVMHTKNEIEAVVFFVETKNWHGEPKINEPHLCDDLQWFDFDNVPENVTPPLKQFLENFKVGKFYSELGWD